MNESAKRMNPYRLPALSALVAIAIIAPALMMGSADTSARAAGNAKATQGDKDQASANAKKDTSVCQELQPCVGDKLASIETTLRDLSALVATAVFADPPLGTFKNKAATCGADIRNAFYNNSGEDAVDTRVGFTIRNAGDCPIEISVSGERNGENAPKTPLLIPFNEQGERTSYVVPKGMYLRARCDKRGREKKCSYEINEVRP